MIVMALFKCICTVFGNIFFEKIVMTLFKSICTFFGDVLFEKFVTALFEFSPARSLLAEEEKSS